MSVYQSSFILALTMALAGSCTDLSPSDAQSLSRRQEAALCSGVQADSRPIHYATGMFNLHLAPNPDENRTEPVPPSEDWLMAVHHTRLNNQAASTATYFTTILGCVRIEGVERWTVSVEIGVPTQAIGAPVSLNTERSVEPPYMLGALTWRDKEGLVQGIQYIGGAFAPGGDATLNNLDPPVQAVEMEYSGYVELAMDLLWEDDNL